MTENNTLLYTEIDGVPFRLRAPFDFGFLRNYGRVFKVFDDQDSGNICFGTADGNERYFVKFAGAPTASYDGSPEDAVTRLRRTPPVYRDLRHPNLIELLDEAEVGSGYALVFRWADGDCMGRMYPEGHRKILGLSAEKKLGLFRDVAEFLRFTAESGYFAVDFYDGSVMYDEASGKTTVCDIDFFRKMPTFNDMGRMWGSSRFQSPEEYRLGAALDEVTNVYTAGAMAFALFGGYRRERDAWVLSDAAYDAAARAVSGERDARHSSIAEFLREWECAVCSR